MDMITIPTRPPHEDGLWRGDDLDRYDFPPHTQIIEGQPVMMMSPQRSRHRAVIHALTAQLAAQVPGQWRSDAEMAVLIDQHNVPEPDVLVVAAQPDYGPDTTRYRVEDVTLACEVESPSTWRDDRDKKPGLYADAGIAYYLRVWEDDGAVFLSYYRLDDGKYVEITPGDGDKDLGTGRWTLEINEPWWAILDLTEC